MRRLLGKREPPWPPLYEWIRRNVEYAQDPGAEAKELPDGAELGSELRWMPGALDGVGARHFGTEGATEAAASIEAMIRAATLGGTPQYWKLYEALRPSTSPVVFDEVLDGLQRDPPPLEELYALAQRLATEGRHRNPVKMGIALMGLVRGGRTDVVMTLGRHEEFTLYAAVGLANSLDDPTDALWELARSVQGWGRIEVVERLKDTPRRDVRDWILREGYSNAVMNEYLAYIAATTGDLVGALSVEEVDDQLLHAAGEILSALIAGGPAESIRDYTGAGDAVELFLRHMSIRASTLEHLNAVLAVAWFLERDDWGEDASHGWTDGRSARLLDEAKEIVDRAEWRALIDEGLRSSDDRIFHHANRAAKALAINTFEIHFRRLQDDPLGFGWGDAFQQADESNVDRLIDLAERTLPLEEIATGPSDALGLGPEFRAHTAFGFVLQGLWKWPGRGWTLLKNALQSPVVGNRNSVLRALETWTRTAWPPDVEAAVRAALAQEPNDRARKAMENLLAGRPIEEPRVDVP